MSEGGGQDNKLKKFAGWGGTMLRSQWVGMWMSKLRRSFSTVADKSAGKTCKRVKVRGTGRTK